MARDMIVSNFSFCLLHSVMLICLSLFCTSPLIAEESFYKESEHHAFKQFQKMPPSKQKADTIYNLTLSSMDTTLHRLAVNELEDMLKMDISDNAKAYTYFYCGDIYKKIRELGKSLYNFSKAFHLQDQLSKTDHLTLLNKTVVINFELGLYEQALSFADLADDYIIEHRQDLNPQTIGYVMGNRSLVLSNIGKKRKSITSYANTITYAEQIKDTNIKIQALYNLASVYREMSILDSAELYSKILLMFSTNNNKIPGIVKSYENLMGIRYDQKQYKEALEFLDSIKTYFNKIEDFYTYKHHKFRFLWNSASVYQKLGNLKKSQYYGELAIGFYNNSAYDTWAVYDVLADTYWELKKYDKYRMVKVKIDSIQNHLNEEKHKALTYLNTKLFEEKIAEAKDKEADSLQKLYLISGVSALLLILLIAVVYLYITKRKALSQNILHTQELEVLNAKLQKQYQELEESNREILAITKELKASNQAKNQFFGIISHDLRSPVSSILQVGYLLSENMDDYPFEKVKRYVENMKDTSTRLLSLLENLLSWAKAQSNAIVSKPRKLMLQDVLDDEISRSELFFDAKKLKITLQCESDLSIISDEYMLRTVVRNLLSNSGKFSHHSGKIDLIVSNHEEQVQIAIRDYGLGISAEDQQHLFTIDKKVSKLGTNKEVGSGLGLNLCKEFVGLLHGKIWFESEVNKGTTFYVELPKV